MAEKIRSVVEGWEKWQIALAVGAPVALGLAGLWFYNRRSPGKTGNVEKKTEKVEAKADAKPEVEQTAQEKAQGAKSKGNKYFKGSKFEQAIKCYTEAIEVCPDAHKADIATFYQNRAAAHEQLKNTQNVIDDCTKALEYNDRYPKALFRRAKAYEATGNLMTCLEDVTAVCIVENFQNQQSLLMADRVLKELGRSKAKEAIKDKKPQEPSPQFIRTYFSAFCNDPIFNTVEKGANREAGSPDSAGGSDNSEPEKHTDETPEKEMIGDGDKADVVEVPTPSTLEKADDEKLSAFQRARRSLQNKEYSGILELCDEEINNQESTHIDEALLLRATFNLLCGEGKKSTADLETLLEMKGVDKRIRSNALIKRGSLKMQNGEQQPALDDFAQAIEEDAENSDIYHHRGQLNLLIERVQEAVEDFEKSVSLSPHFAIAHVQKSYTEYRLALSQASQSQLQQAIKSFEENISRFNDCAEGYALYGQALCDQQMFEKADENFQKALELEPDNGNIYVHRGLLRLQWKQDIDAASNLIQKALEVDSKCEFAYETLGTIEVQRGNVDQAIALFNKAIALAKTEVEMAHLFSLLDAAIAQSRIARRFGITVPGMAPM